MPKHNKGERKKTERFVAIKSYEFKSPAFQALSGDEVKIYLIMRSRYNGNNNGKIMFSSRQAGEVINKSHSTGARALFRLAELGFIKVAQQSSFGQKRLSREYELTAIALRPAERGDKLPAGTKDFLKFTKSQIETLDVQRKRLAKTKPSVMGEGHSVMGENGGAKVVAFGRC